MTSTPRRRVSIAASCIGAVSAGALPAAGGLGTSLLSAVLAPHAAADLHYNPYPGPWNGKKVYLSPARHTDAGGRGECNGNNENNMAFGIALNAVNHLTSSGYNYQVRIGNGTLQSAISNSNAWGSNAHLPLHSNARSEACSNTTASVHGTNTIYRAGVGTSQLMAQRILDNVGPQTPGTNDFICYNPGQPCTSIDLGELRSVSAPYRAYSEVEYHTWTTGTNWLTGGAATAGFKIALAVYAVV